VINHNDQYAKLISIAIDATIVFFGIAIFLFVALSLLQIYLEKNRKEIETKKIAYIDIINLSLFDDTILIEAKEHNDYIALSYAISEINNFLLFDDRKHIHDIIEKTKLDIYLWNKYKKSYFKIFKRKYFLKIVYISYPHFKNFFFQKMRDKKFFMQKEAIYGYAALSKNKKDLAAISLTIKNHFTKKIDFKFLEFIYEEAIKNTPKIEIEKFVKTLKHYNRIIVKSILFAIYTFNKDAKSLLIYIYQLYKNDEEFIIDTITLLARSRLKYCKIIKENYLHPSKAVRYVCAKYAFVLCDKDAINFLYIYFFDPEHLIRNVIRNSSKEALIQIADILNSYNKHLKISKTRSDILDIY